MGERPRTVRTETKTETTLMIKLPMVMRPACRGTGSRGRRLYRTLPRLRASSQVVGPGCVWLAPMPVAPRGILCIEATPSSGVLRHGPCFRHQPLVSGISRRLGGGVSNDRSARPVSVWKSGTDGLRESYLRDRRDGMTIGKTNALLGFTSARAAVWESDADDSERHHTRVEVDAEGRFCAAPQGGADLDVAARAAGVAP